MANKMTCFLGYIAVFSLLSARSTLCAETAPSCPDVVSYTAPCLPYISHTSASPSDICCTGVQNVANMAMTHDNQVSICSCLKTEMAAFTYDPALVASLPSKCAVNLNFPPISSDTDCSKISFGN